MEHIFVKKKMLGEATYVIFDVLGEYDINACVLMIEKIKNIEYGDYCISLACTPKQKSEIDERLSAKTVLKKKDNRHKPFKREVPENDVPR